MIAPSIACHRRSIPLSASYSVSPSAHRSWKTPAAFHSWKRRWAEELEQIPVALSAFHWQPVRSTKKIASIARRLSTRGRWPPKRCGLPGGSKGSIRSHNASGIRHWSSLAIALPSSPRRTSRGELTSPDSYWDRL